MRKKKSFIRFFVFLLMLLTAVGTGWVFLKREPSEVTQLRKAKVPETDGGHQEYYFKQLDREEKRAYREILDEILKVLIEKGIGLECNTAGFKYGLGHPNPTEEILLRYHELGGEILTLGSDGHAPKHLAYDFEKAGNLLKACGFRYYTIFKNRKPEFHKL